MKLSMNRSLPAVVLLLAALSAPLAAAADPAAPDGASSLSDREASHRSPREKRPSSADLFIHLLSVRTGAKELELQNLWNRGYGRNELIKLVLISKKADKQLKEVVIRRDKKERIPSIAAAYGIDYSALLDEAGGMRLELDQLLTGYPSATFPTTATEVAPSAAGDTR